MRYTVLKDGSLKDPEGNVWVADPNSEVRLPGVYRPFNPYISPVSGKMIEDHAARREDLKRHGCIEAGDRKPMEPRDEKKLRKYLSPSI